MKKLLYSKCCLFIISLVLFPAVSCIGQTYITAGDVSGTWTSAGSPYYIQGEITIPNSETLTLEPGVGVVFLGHYKFNVQGRLLAVGTQIDSIRITAANTDSGWHGIRFNLTSVTNDTSKIVYCSLKYGKANTGSGFDRSGGAIFIRSFDKVLISNCLFEYNMQSGGGWNPPEAAPAIYAYYASPIITNSTFSNNYSTSKGSAIGCLYSPNAITANNIFLNNNGVFGPIAYAYNSGGTISGNIIFNNVASYFGSGILVDNSANPRIINNVIIHNQAPAGGGIVCFGYANPVLINNTISYNNASNTGGGIYCANSNPILINNILYGNSAAIGVQVYLNDVNSDPGFLYSDIQGGKDAFGGNGAGVNYTGLYENNIDSDPLFVDVTTDDFRLSDLSPCIGAGIDSIEINNNWYFAPFFDYYGNPRPNPAECMPDIGALESALCNPATTISINPTELDFGEVAIDSSSTMIFTIMNTGNADLEVTNISSNEPAFTVNITSAIVLPDSSQEVEVTFTPTGALSFNGIIEITHNALGSPDTVAVTGNGITGIDDELLNTIPNEFVLYQNFPNPFNPSTTISWQSPVSSRQTLKVFDVLGNEIETLIDEYKPAGKYEIEFNAANLPSGVYFYQLIAGSYVETKKMVLLC